MAANAKYQRAPQRDSFEESSYTQAPPSYQADSDQNQNLLSGGARGEDDNLPDDFKFGGSVSEATLPIRMQFVRKVYAILLVDTIQPSCASITDLLQDCSDLGYGGG